MFIPEKVYYEKGVEEYPLGMGLLERYKNLNIEMHEIQNHNNIPELRELPDSDFTKLKKYLILGIRKTLRLIPNKRSADYIVPFTSSGCSAMCLYCYLVCTFFKNSYLRIFVNRDEMMDSVRKMAARLGKEKVYEIGSNSDMILENQITGNLRWAVEKFAAIPNARSTFATKFADIEDLLELDHKGHTQMRISINPEILINKVEIGTAKLTKRIEAANKMHGAGYKVGINLAPIILTDNWRELYSELFITLEKELDEDLKIDTFFELIFMTFGLANETINKAAMPGTFNVFEKSKMRPKGRGKYCYRPDILAEAKEFMINEVHARFPKANISYIV